MSPEPAKDSAALEPASPPLTPAHESAAALHGDAEAQAADADDSNKAQAAGLKKKKKNRGNRKSAAKRGPTALPKNRGTGFEEFFADPPLTPDEASEEKDHIYARRIQSCIQRFRARRRLSPEQSRYFNEYLFLGGIDTSGKAFGGLEEKDTRTLTPAERLDATATDAVHSGSAADDRYYHGDDEHWSVDFTGVLAGFFSTSLLIMTGGDLQKMETAAALAENFLKYILHHDVCPEYEDDVKRALRLCTDAREEWPLLDELQHSLPGAFHLSAIDLFSPPSPEDWNCSSLRLPEGFDAKAIFYSACALLGEVEVLKAAQQGRLGIAKEHTCALEVVEIQQPRADVAERFGRLEVADSKLRAGPIGKAFFKPTTIEDGWETPVIASPYGESGGSWLYFEQSLLANMRPGMKMALTIVELDAGIRFVKAVTDVVPTFYTFLPQVLMKYYKQPRVNERPAPSVQDPHAEEEQQAREANED
ncbi:argonaute siRNA chaperone (ARC) complex subunit arb1 domain-containing protein [Hirsutella rhossiliensis]|uniref:Argonaute siRNA chaperone (ARC) complex subunit arb1 domain-containing protein n=1 Tax=Hirsutella rhossiliensis TaxID=111463 RepID=A0A9P8SGF9_9HYPO|nr:argonaute siRNA chaperone (ARC) complex subunit arb1 domain-containing protein [Hirsutella rhossiliensis]KAH0961084.1 argonaute siRNA chaperone (ARC) complex subunit arb1 domain-containing protein [Hirsutella rhossiliensis]